MTPDELDLRTKTFALRVVKLVDALPTSVSGRAIGQQLVRSGTSVAANYRAARRARSTREFIAKLSIVTEEADESCFWLELVGDAGLLKASQLEPLRQEAFDLTKLSCQEPQNRPPKRQACERRTALHTM